MRRLGAHGAKQVLIVGLVLGVAAGCGSLSLDGPAPPGNFGLGTGGATTIRFDAGKTLRDAGPVLNALCGHNFNCTGIPDDPNACRNFIGPAPVDGGHGTGGTAGAAGAGGAFGAGGIPGSGGSSGQGGPVDAGHETGPHDGGADASDSSDAQDATTGHEGGADADASRGLGDAMDQSSPARRDGEAGTSHQDASDEEGGPTIGPPPEVDAGPAFSCQVGAPPRKTDGEPFYQCLAAGDHKSGSPCSSSSDCRAGLACAGAETPVPGKALAGRCLPYCCDPATVCREAWLAGGGDPNDPDVGSRLYCGDRELIDPTSSTPQRVPVCVTAVPCSLNDPYPCTDASCTRRNGTACTVKVISGDAGGSVGIHGTTACDVPGTGRTGARCSSDGKNACAAGYFCSEAAGVCLKVCNTDGYGAPCSPGKCQATAGFPSGWGVCVGPAPSAK